MREWTPQSHLEEAFRKVLFRLVNQYLSFPEDVTHGKIVRTLVAFQQARAALEDCAGTLVLRTSSEENCHPHGRGTKPGQAAKGKFKNCAFVEPCALEITVDKSPCHSLPAERPERPRPVPPTTSSLFGRDASGLRASSVGRSTADAEPVGIDAHEHANEG